MARIEFRLSEELKEEIGRAADAADMAMNEFMAKVLAEQLGRPDLAAIPRGRLGRPRKHLLETV